MDRVEQEWDLFEPEEDLQARIANYDKAQKQVWAELVECCKGTPDTLSGDEECSEGLWHCCVLETTGEELRQSIHDYNRCTLGPFVGLQTKHQD